MVQTSSTEDSSTNPKVVVVEEMAFLPYTRAFLLDEESLSAFERVRPLKEGLSGHIFYCVGKALLLPKDMERWEDWTDEDLLLNIKREAIMVSDFPKVRVSLSILFLLSNPGHHSTELPGLIHDGGKVGASKGEAEEDQG